MNTTKPYCPEPYTTLMYNSEEEDSEHETTNTEYSSTSEFLSQPQAEIKTKVSCCTIL
jgi:hypothetical protein